MQLWIALVPLLSILCAVSPSTGNPETTAARLSLEGHYYRPFILKEIEQNDEQFSYESLSDSDGYMELVLERDEAKRQDGYLVHYDGLEKHQYYGFELERQDDTHFDLRFKTAAPVGQAQLHVSKNDTIAQTLVISLADSDYTFKRRVFKPEGSSEWTAFENLERYIMHLHYAGSYKLLVNGGKTRKIQLDYQGNVTGAPDLLNHYVLRQNTAGYDIVYFGQKENFPPKTINKVGTVEMLTTLKKGFEYGDYYADKWIFRFIPQWGFE